MQPDLAEYMTLPYATEVEADEVDGRPCFVARNPELPGCTGWGYTPQAAVEDLKSARYDYIRVRLNRGLPVPEPAFKPQQIGGISVLPPAKSVPLASGEDGAFSFDLAPEVEEGEDDGAAGPTLRILAAA
jgi:predicted RNase H-like HicB family nuclease